VYLQRIALTNVKGFEHVDLDLAPESDGYPGWTVITGDNGSGKTALLRAISLALLGPDQARDLLPSPEGWVRYGADVGLISVEIRPDHEVDRTLKGGFPVQGTFWAELAIEQDDATRTWMLNPTDVYRKKKKGATNGPWQPVSGWFGLAYGPFRRLYGSSPDAQRLMVLPGRSPQYGTLFREDATLSEAEEWVKSLQFRRLENRADDARTLEGLLAILNHDFLRLGVRVDEVNSDGLWLVDSANSRMKLADMSEGYRAALAMLIDIFRHLTLTYGPDIVKRDPDGTPHVAAPGVVMIDEVDAHLHPGWQRDIGFWLKRHFPRIQFIVTTHSPLVCQAVDSGRIFHLPALGDGAPYRLSPEEYNSVIAGRADDVLRSDAFGLRNTRSDLAVAALRRHAELRSKRSAGPLSPEEEDQYEQLSIFAEVAAGQER
jgi:hypothetical protein